MIALSRAKPRLMVKAAAPSWTSTPAPARPRRRWRRPSADGTGGWSPGPEPVRAVPRRSGLLAGALQRARASSVRRCLTRAPAPGASPHSY